MRPALKGPHFFDGCYDADDTELNESPCSHVKTKMSHNPARSVGKCLSRSRFLASPGPAEGGEPPARHAAAFAIDEALHIGQEGDEFLVMPFLELPCIGGEFVRYQAGSPWPCSSNCQWGRPSSAARGISCRGQSRIWRKWRTMGVGDSAALIGLVWSMSSAICHRRLAAPILARTFELLSLLSRAC
jgi:hypothetical protein